ncbi:hypothetical protein [Methylocella sp. CPCC 101449]|uniref:hypothetical protein n=1 Tax=Methylocella sp. CPCC 101449 TaxID=2987531 RepID=UPI00288ED1DB|nr:hypothetical protein [Methylocella sp. CPCC 101449]MDT2020475.1 hypothetical protein [Methylocella sp. CPCC 101449]
MNLIRHATRRRRAAYLAATSLGALTVSWTVSWLGAGPALACSPSSTGTPAPMPYYFDCSGARGADDYHQSNGQDGGDGGVANATLPYDVTAHTQDGSGAVTVISRGGDGGNGKDYASSQNHWGGNGGAGGTVNFSAANIVITNQTGPGVVLDVSGGKAGAYAFMSDDGNDVYGTGGSGGQITLNLQNVTINANGTAALIATANGGHAAPSSIRAIGANPSGGEGGFAGAIGGTISGNVSNAAGAGFVLQGNGDVGGMGTGDGDHPSGMGGLGGAINVTYAAGTMNTKQVGIYATSFGGIGGSAQPGYQTPGGAGGDGGQIYITVGSGASITTSADTTDIYNPSAIGDGVFAWSRGGAGGNGGDSGFLNPHTGKPGGDGGAGDLVSISNYGSISTLGFSARGMVAISEGGFGGSGGSDSGIIYSHAGNGGSGGSEGDVLLDNYGSVSTRGHRASGVVGQSLGGGGATAGSANGGIVSIGGSGGNAGSGGWIVIHNQAGGSIKTQGNQSSGLVGQSIGGGGGDAGSALAIGVLIPITVSIGGSGGDGGNGGTVNISNRGSIDTGSGHQSFGILAQSIGGGGGNGGNATSDQLTLAPPNPSGISLVSVNLAIGGRGGHGGDGDHVSVDNYGMITTRGAQSHGIFAQSIGGGGGNGGSATSNTITVAPNVSLSFTASIGGSGGVGGAGGGVSVYNDANGEIATSGHGAAGVFAQSVGGGGGQGGSAISHVGGAALVTGYSLTAGLNLGGSGGSGNVGGGVDLINNGAIGTSGDHAYGLFGQSIGGGGGIGGNSQGLSSPTPVFNATVTLGGAGGSGNTGGPVTVANGGHIATAGAGSVGIFAQSVGGGGGNGGNASSVANSVYQSAFSDVNALQSVALAIAKGTINFIPGVDPNDPTPPGKLAAVNVSVGVTVGGAGGSGNHGGYVEVDNTGSVDTFGAGSTGILAQSIGGGGGNGGSVDSVSNMSHVQLLLDLIAATGSGGASIYGGRYSPNIGGQFSVGGSGGGGGDGGSVIVNNTGTVTTRGDNSPGIIAQSIGGGGGNGGGVEKPLSSLLSDLDQSTQDLINGILKLVPYQASGAISFSVGGRGGAAGDGGSVTVTNAGTIVTLGDNADGIFAQSIGGGGGNGAHAAAVQNSGTVDLTFEIGGKGGGGGNGGTVAVDLQDGAGIHTNGVNAIGIWAQSVGGGGGKSAEKFGGGIGVIGGHGNWYSRVGADGASGSGGAATVTTRANSSITTAGELSHGILVQSVGGGGGGGVITSDVPFAPSTAAVNVQAPTHDLGGTGGAHGDGGAAAATVGGTIQTSGALAFGVLAQSVGAGGGYSAFAGSSSPFDLKMGATGNASGAGGLVTVTTQAGSSIVTSGQNAFGVLAQSVGGGGGVAGLTSQSNLINLTVGSGQGSGNGGTVNVDVYGRIQTSGAGAAGVVAQSIGGGGGLAGNMAGVTYDVNLVRGVAQTGGSGDGGTLNINVIGNGDSGNGHPGLIRTTGANAPAILAMSIGGGAVFTDAGLLLRQPSGGTGHSGGAINITVDKAASVIAQGANSPGIYAISFGNVDAASGEPGGAINITIGNYSTVQGGTGAGGAGIVTKTTQMTTINNSGSISSLGPDAIVTAGEATIVNTSTGSINGNVRIGHGGTLVNAGDFNPNDTIDLGVFGELRNTGYLDLTSNGYGVTRLTGGFIQTIEGNLVVGVDFLNNRSDQLSVSSGSSFAGTINFETQNPLRGRSLTIAHFDTPLLDFSAKPIDINGLPISYNLQLSADGSNVSVSANGNFSKAAAALPADRANTAHYLQALWDSGYEGAAPLFTYFARLNSAKGYGDMLSGMANDATHSRLAAQAHHSYSFFNTLMSCPYFLSGSTQRGEGECVWGRVTGNRVNRSGTSDDTGYRATVATYQIGAQRQIAHNWFLGGSLSYMASDTKSDANAVAITSNTVNVGLALKRQMGPWLFAAAVRAGYESSDMTRQVFLPGFGAVARSRPQFVHFGGRLRAAYEFSFDNWYLKPFADLDISYVRQSAYRETGAGLFDLAALATSRTSVMATPGLEIGGRIDINKTMTLRPYLIGGVSFLGNGGWTARMQLADFALSSIAPFQITTGAPKVYGNLTAGLELATAGGFELRAEYILRGARNYIDQTASLRAALRF